MFDSPVLEVVIGVVLVYLLVSMLCSALMELVAARLKLRAKDLQDGLRLLLGVQEPQRPRGLLTSIGRAASGIINVAAMLLKGSRYGDVLPGGGIAGAFFDHALIRGLMHGDKLPSYIAPRTFSAALVDLVNSPASLDVLQTVLRQVDALPEAAQGYVRALLTPNSLQYVRVAVRNLPAGAVRDELDWVFSGEDDTVGRRAAAVTNAETLRYLEALLTPASLERVRGWATDLPDQPDVVANAKRELIEFLDSATRLTKSLKALLRGAEADLEKARREIEKWFDEGMERVSGWYKRRAQAILLAVALPIVVALNADTVSVSLTLWQDDILRDAFVSQAEQLVRATPAATPEVVATPGAATLPAVATPTPAAGAGAVTNSTPTPEQKVNEVRQQLKGLQILGWRGESDAQSDPREHPRVRINLLGLEFGRPNEAHNDQFSLDLTGWLEKLAGLAITWLAVSQGAPFWFDLLKKLVNVRSSGRSPAPSGGTGSSTGATAASTTGAG